VISSKQDIIRQLKVEILHLQGFERSLMGNAIDFGLGPINRCFPYNNFPTRAVHEFISAGRETAAASASFVSGLAGRLMDTGGACLWISASRLVSPPALKQFCIEPDQVIFIDLKKEKEVLWAIEEALTCESLAAVIGEVREINFTASRRLQLAVEKSHTTGFLLRDNPRTLNANACAARWRIQPLASRVPVDGMPGIGFHRWSVELLKVKNGQTGSWQLEWAAGRFQAIFAQDVPLLQRERRRKAG
jgi:protein ImuA